jgi:type VI secretion system protein VasG
MGVDSGALIKTLNTTCVDALQSAAGLCLSRTNHSVEIEHWLLKLAELHHGDVRQIFNEFDVETSRLIQDLTQVIDGFRIGNQRTPTLSTGIDKLIRDAWMLTSIRYQSRRVRSGVLLLALLDGEKSGRLIRESSRELAKIKVDMLQSNLMKLVAGSTEDDGSTTAEITTNDARAGYGACVSKTPALDQYTINLTERARMSELDPVIGREAEVRQIVDILIRRRQNNPILVGEAGVGKTAVVEGLALRIAAGDVPPSLKCVSLRTLDLGLLQAGAGIKGEFENRLKQVIDEVKRSAVPTILFIDEAHTMIGAGGQAGQNDAANLLKPALARGELRTIAATTWAEYKKYFEKDAALARRFQVIKIDEPSEEIAIQMLRGLVSTLEKHHGVRVLDEAVVSAVKLSHRYIPVRQLPDKAVSLFDTACARVALGLNAVPTPVEDYRRRIDHLRIELDILERERALGADHHQRIDEKREELQRFQTTLTDLESRWKNERERADSLRALAREIESHYHQEKKRCSANGGLNELSNAMAAMQADLKAQTEELRDYQGESPLLDVFVDSQTIAQVVAAWTGVPVGKMMTDEIRGVLSLREKLEERVVGQSHALEAISKRIRSSRANLTDPRRPTGVFLLAGPSGVGKTETALALADALYGGERNLITINMSEFQEAHTVSSLKGAPPGYVGYGEGGVLTEAVRRRPYSVVLLDEIEKAHPDVLELFFQVFDKGTLEDGEGREIDFRNTVILLTSNVGTEAILTLCKESATTPALEALAESIRPNLVRATTERGVPIFKQAFLGRLIVVPYCPINEMVMRRIIRMQLDRIGHRLNENHNATFTYDDLLIACIADRCREAENGARNVDQILTRSVLPEISEQILARMARGEALSSVHVSVDDKREFRYTLD